MGRDDRRGFFRGGELGRLLLLAAIMVVGWAMVWQYGHARPQAEEPTPRAGAIPEPVAPDKATEFESVSDRTPLGFRDNAAYAYLLRKARDLSPAELAARARRDILLTHLWERPELYRGVPVHILGTARRTLRYESKLSRTGWLYETWVVTPDERKVPYCCVSEEVREGFPLGANVAETVVFNGYFLKIMKYEAADTARGSPLLVGKVGWDAPATGAGGAAAPAIPGGAMPPRLFWTLAALGVIFLLTLGRWARQLRQSFGSRPRASSGPRPTEDIQPEDLEDWVNNQARADGEGWDEDRD
ncbi:hypothetical protein OJF2_60250 [Aquisphaera giovannonii]|uniref:Uncharacterized protein n=1 Tax=Aquisphaera giovannonii TaxID=406548 RepID=A0A5B9WB15_9BACT|nr:hypothetical protein [Aquisphaera giovannonii]QEH37434.1 hypothetical protein OJF2_60250 [Aquisphaera giovannonii]